MRIEYSDIIKKTPKYAFAEIDNKVAALKKKGIDVIDFGVGDPKSPPPKFVVEHLSEAARNHQASGYPSYVGRSAFRKACSEYLFREYSISLDPKHEISSTIGSKEAVFHFPLGFVNAGDVVICPTPAYPVYKSGTRFASAVPYIVPLLEENNFLINFKKIPEEIAKKAKIIWINYPNSPTGVTAPLDWMEELVKWANKNNIIIAADEGCYNEFYFNEKPSSILEIQKEGIITFYSLSKRNNMTGYRVGFVAGDKCIVDGFKKVKTNVDSGTANFIQDAAILALNDKAHVQEMCEEYRKKRQILLTALKEVGFEEPLSDATFYLWVKAPGSMNGIELTNKLMDLGIVVTPGAAISEDVDGLNPGKNFIRMALVPTLQEIEKAASIIRTEFRL